MDLLPTSIESERLLIRHWTEADVDQMDAAITASIEHLRPWMPWIAAEPLSRTERLKLIRNWQQEWAIGGDSTYGVFLDEVAIGGTGLHRRLGEGGLEIGYWIHVDHVRHGYATEVARALTHAAFEQPDIDRVEIHHDRTNVASGRVPRRLGYTFIGQIKRDITAPGQDGVLYVWRVSRHEWVAN